MNATFLQKLNDPVVTLQLVEYDRITLANQIKSKDNTSLFESARSFLIAEVKQLFVCKINSLMRRFTIGK